MTQSEQAFFLLPSSPPSSFIVTLSFFPLVVFFLPLSQPQTLFNPQPHLHTQLTSQRLRRRPLLLAPQGPPRPRHRLSRLDNPGRLPFPLVRWRLALRRAAGRDERGPRAVPDASRDGLAFLDLPDHL